MLIRADGVYSAHQKSGDSLSFSYYMYLPLQHHVLSNKKKTPMHFQTL